MGNSLNHCNVVHNFVNFISYGDSWCKLTCHHSVLNFQSRVTKIDGLILLTREAIVESSCGPLESFTAMPTSTKVRFNFTLLKSLYCSQKENGTKNCDF